MFNFSTLNDSIPHELLSPQKVVHMLSFTSKWCWFHPFCYAKKLGVFLDPFISPTLNNKAIRKADVLYLQISYSIPPLNTGHYHPFPWLAKWPTNCSLFFSESPNTHNPALSIYNQAMSSLYSNLPVNYPCFIQSEGQSPQAGPALPGPPPSPLVLSPNSPFPLMSKTYWPFFFFFMKPVLQRWWGLVQLFPLSTIFLSQISTKENGPGIPSQILFIACFSYTTMWTLLLPPLSLPDCVNKDPTYSPRSTDCTYSLKLCAKQPLLDSDYIYCELLVWTRVKCPVWAGGLDLGEIHSVVY